jgi:uncharacterized Zn finger protein
VIGEAFDRDPFLLFELRGRTKQQTLDALRAARAQDNATTTSAPTSATTKTPPTKRRRAASTTQPPPTAAEPLAGVAFPKLDPQDFDRLPHPLPALELRFEEPAQESALLAQLGVPPQWTERRSPAELFGGIVKEAGRLAREWALGEVEESADPEQDEGSASETPVKPARRGKGVGTTKKKAARR